MLARSSPRLQTDARGRRSTGGASGGGQALDSTAFDIHLDGRSVRQDSRPVDRVGSKGSRAETGSIHTIQSYDLDHEGVVIGPDLCCAAEAGRIRFDRSWYRDRNGTANKRRLWPVPELKDADVLVTTGRA